MRCFLMFNILILQQWYGLNDLEVERQIADRISFMSFLGFSDSFPDSGTIWLFRERMTDTGKDEIVWAELQRQLDALDALAHRYLLTSQDIGSEAVCERTMKRRERSMIRSLVKAGYSVVKAEVT